MAHPYQHPCMFKLAKATKQLVPSEMVPASHQQPRHSEEDVGTNLSEFDVLPETKLAPSKYPPPLPMAPSLAQGLLRTKVALVSLGQQSFLGG